MSDNPERCANYLRIIRLIVDVGTDTVRDLFYFYKPKEKVFAFFASETIYKELSDLKRKHVISYEQFEKLTFEPNLEDLDISLLITIIVNLFKWTVEPPKNGWDKPVGDDDNSLGACLLRLKRLRNSLVGHSADAKLSTEEFEAFWEQAVSLLTQIAKYTRNDKIEEVIRSYRSSPLDNDDEKEKRYIALLRQWHEEGVYALASLQKEVEDLCKTTDEFGLFFKSNIPDRYKRYVLLLFEGGLLVLADILKRELRKDGTDLKSVLIQNKYDIQLLFFKDSPNSIYKDGTIETDVSKWGLQKLMEVILCVYGRRLNRMEWIAISSIGNACEDFAKVAMASLDSDKFRSYWTDIVSNINILSVGLDDDTQIACQDLIKKHDTGPVDESTAQMYLLQMRQDCSPLQSLVHQYIGAREKLKNALEQMQREGACFGHDQVVELKMMTNGKTEEKRRLAENILHSVWEKAVSLSGDSGNFEAIKEAVDKILERIKALPDVKVTSVEKHCIILAIECSSSTGLLGLMDFIESTPFMECIQSFNHTFSEYCEEEIIVTAFITIDSILQTMETLCDSDNKRSEYSIGIKLSCSSVDAIRNLQQTVECSETSNSINKIAQVLSEDLKEKISIDTFLDMGAFDDMYNEKPFAPFVSSAWTSFMLPHCDDEVERQLPLCSRTSRLRGILEEIVVPEKNIQKTLSDFLPETTTRHMSLLDLLNSMYDHDFVKSSVDRWHESRLNQIRQMNSRHKYRAFRKKRTRRKSRLKLKFEEIDPLGQYFCSSPMDSLCTRSFKSTKSPTCGGKFRLTRKWSSLPILSSKEEDNTFPYSVTTKRPIRSKSCDIIGRPLPLSIDEWEAATGYEWDHSIASEWKSWDLSSDSSDSCSSTEDIVERRFGYIKSFERDFPKNLSMLDSHTRIFRKKSVRRDSPTTFASRNYRDLSSCSSFESFNSAASCDSRRSDFSTRSMY